MGKSLRYSQLALISAVLAALQILCYAQGIQSPVDTTSGEVTGKSVNFRGKTLWEFKMVPYAEPPVGDLRFKPPQPKTRETSTIDGSKDAFKICSQNPFARTEIGMIRSKFLINQNVSQDEDCLYLDVYVPESAGTTSLLPVMFWIHGGGYASSAGRFSSGRVLASDFDVVVVTFNYRLNIFGFLNTEDDNAVGDFGLRDQVLALQWVNNNIGKFGGDPRKITIAGESAGGSSVAQLTVAPLSEGLFQRAIIQSGGLDNAWACVQNPKAIATAFAVSLKCSVASTAAIVECMRKKTPEEIMEVLATQGLANMFVPACSGSVIPYTQSQLETTEINSDVAKRLAKLDILIGVNSQEGAMLFELLTFNQTDNQGGISKATADNVRTAQLSLIGMPAKHIKSLHPSIRFLYTDWEMPQRTLARSKKVIDLGGDTLFLSSAIKYINLHSKIQAPAGEKGQEYFYFLKHRPSWMTPKPFRYGADHGDDLFFVFGNPLEYPSLNATAEEKVLSQTVMTYWTNFIKTGNPNTPLATVNSSPLVTWPQYDLDNQKYLQLDITMDSSSVDQRLFADRMTFWIDYIPTELKRLEAIKPPPPCKIVDSAGSVTYATIFSMIVSSTLLFWLHNK